METKRRGRGGGEVVWVDDVEGGNRKSRNVYDFFFLANQDQGLEVS